MEAKDYRSRTPLHLAINIGKIVSTNYLLSLTTPPDVRVKDKDGNMAISAMIHSMPRMVRIETSIVFFISWLFTIRNANTNDLVGHINSYKYSIFIITYTVYTGVVFQQKSGWASLASYIFDTIKIYYILFILTKPPILYSFVWKAS